MPKVVMYTTAICPYCVRAKYLLGNKGVSFEEIRIDTIVRGMQQLAVWDGADWITETMDDGGGNDNTNTNGKVDLSDAIFSVFYQFAKGPAPSCAGKRQRSSPLRSGSTRAIGQVQRPSWMMWRRPWMRVAC